MLLFFVSSVGITVFKLTSNAIDTIGHNLTVANNNSTKWLSILTKELSFRIEL